MKRYTDWDKVAWEVLQYDVVEPTSVWATCFAYVMLPYRQVVSILGAAAWPMEDGEYSELGWGIRWGDGAEIMISARTKHYGIDSEDPEVHYRALRAHEEDWTVWFPSQNSLKKASEIFRRLQDIFGDKIITYRQALRSSLRTKVAGRWVVDVSSFDYFMETRAPYQIWQMGDPYKLLYLGDDVSVVSGDPGYLTAGKIVLAQGAWLPTLPQDESALVSNVVVEKRYDAYTLLGTWEPRTASLALASEEPKSLDDVLRTVEAWTMNHPVYDEVKQKFEGPRHRAIRTLPGAATKYHYEGDSGAVAVRYHFTDVVTFYPQYIVLDTGGYDTVTTASKMDTYLRQAHVPVRVTRRNGSVSIINPADWTVIAPVNRMLVMDYSGNILANGQSESRDYIDANPSEPMELLP